jgi:hypothetical protein
MLIEPITPAGKDWLEENLQQERTTFGRCIAAEPRFVPSWKAHRADGLVVA